MGHYDNCRPENCGICGQSLGSCEHTKTYRSVNTDPAIQTLSHSGVSAKIPDYNPDFKVLEEAMANLGVDKLLMYVHEETKVPDDVKDYLKERDIELVIHPAIPIGKGLLFKVPTKESAIVIPHLDIESKTCFNCGKYGECDDPEKCSSEGIGWEKSE